MPSAEISSVALERGTPQVSLGNITSVPGHAGQVYHIPWQLPTGAARQQVKDVTRAQKSL